MLTSIFICITHLGSPVAISLFSAVIIAILLYKKRYTDAVWFAGYMAAVLVVVFGLKHALAIPRPKGGLITEDGYSFPSGHASMSTAFSSGLYMLFGNHFSKRQRFFGAVLLFLFAALVSVSRVYLGVHRPEDVLVGISIALLIGQGLSYLKVRFYDRIAAL